MPKGGSGFGRDAARQAGLALGGSAGQWRINDVTVGDQYKAEIAKLYRSMYRSGLTIQRDSRGRVIQYNGSDDAMLRAGDRMLELAQRIAKDIQIYNPAAAETYRNMRQTWGKPVYVNSRELREFRDTMQAGDRMLINPRGRRGIASDAAGRTEEAGWRGGGNNNVDILSRANRQMNATRDSIWQNVSALGNKAVDDFTGEINERIMNRYERTERSAARRRRK